MPRKRVISRKLTLYFSESVIYNRETKSASHRKIYYPVSYESNRNKISEFIHDSEQLFPNEDLVELYNTKAFLVQASMPESKYLKLASISAIKGT